MVTVTILQDKGYSVYAFGDPTDAMEQVKNAQLRADLLMTDVIMPGMNGRHLYERIRQIQADIRVLFVSGYTGETIAHHGILDDDTNFLQKPFSAQGLLEKTRESLDRPSSVESTA